MTTTVIVCTVDRPAALSRCLAGIAEGTSTPGEILVVDQGGREETRTAVAAAGATLVVSPRKGLSAARNDGLARAGGEIVAVTDDDCVPDRGWLEAIVTVFDAEPEIVGVAGPMLPLGDETAGLAAVSSRTGTVARVFSGGARPWEVGTGGNMAFRRDALVGLGGYDERLGVGSRGRAGEDLDIVRRLLAAGAQIRYEPAAVCRHERKTMGEQRRTRTGYGYGAGAALGRWLRDGDPGALAALAGWLALRARLAASPERGPASRRVADELRILEGTLRGLVYGLRLEPWRPA